MKFFPIFLLMTLPFLPSCAANIQKPEVINGNKYIDSTIPRTEIIFPFNVEYKSTKTDYYEQEKTTTNELISKEKKIIIYIKKSKLIDIRYYFTRADSSRTKDNIYLDQKSNGFCSVDIFEKNLNSYLRGKSYRYISHDKILSIEMYKPIGYISSQEKFINENKNEVEDFTTTVKSICAQNEKIVAKK